MDFVNATSLLIRSTAILGLCTLVFYFVKQRRKAAIINRIPGPPGNFLLGNILQLRGKKEEIIFRVENLYEKYRKNGISRFWIGNVPIVAVFNGQIVEELLKSQIHIDKAFPYEFLTPWLGMGLVTSTGKKWQSRRRLITSAFHFQILEDFVPIVNEQSQIMNRLLVQEINKPFDIFSYITLCALDIICATGMGTNLNAQIDRDSDYIKAVYTASEAIFERTFKPWLHPEFLFQFSGEGRNFKKTLNVLHGFTKKVIRDRKNELMANGANGESQREKGSKKRLAFLDLLIDYSDGGKVLSDEDIQEEVDTFMFEGHDTTASGMYWAIYLLGLHPEIQQKLHDELDSIFGDSDRAVTSDDLKRLQYLECVCKESLRICPPVPIIGRKITEPLTLGGYEIPPDTTVAVASYWMHRDENIFPEPDQFNPDRFLPENSRDRHPYAYIPFSAGPRNCMGQKFAMMEEKVVLANFFRKFTVKTLNENCPLNKCSLADGIMMPKSGIEVVIRPRKSN